MKKKRRGWLFGLIAVLLLMGGAATFFIVGRFSFIPGRQHVTDGAPLIAVDILDPVTANSFRIGQPIQVVAQVWSLAPVDRVELILDGQIIDQLNEDTLAKPQQITFIWQGDIPGAHSLVVRVTDLQGQTSSSQSVVINLTTSDFLEVNPVEGADLSSFSQENATSPGEVVNLNPGLDPELGLSASVPLIVPAPNTGAARGYPFAEGPNQGPDDAVGLDMLIDWAISFGAPVDQSYCYQSTNATHWQRVPANSFSFLPGQRWQQPVLLSAQQSNMILILDCWGWSTGVLNYLGQGQTIVDLATTPGEIVLAANGFEAVGIPVIAPQAMTIPASKLPAPYGLRSPQSPAECADHYGNATALLLCEEWMSAPVQQYNLLIWEWKPQPCLPGDNYCQWIDEISGYQVFEVDEKGLLIGLLQTLDAGRQMTPIPIPWGSVCYGVRAYTGHPLGSTPYVTSEMDIYCPSDPPSPETLEVEMDAWVSSEGWTLISSKCPGFDYGDRADEGVPPKSMYPTGKQILVGDQWLNLSNCKEHRNAKALIHFPLDGLPSLAVIQRATLKFVHQGNSHLYAYGSASNQRPLCATRLYTLQQPGEVPFNGRHLVDHHLNLPNAEYDWGDLFYALTAGAPYQALGSTTTVVDVTSDVSRWHNSPEQNHGFSIQSWTTDLEAQGIIDHTSEMARCWSTLNEIQLVIEYFSP